MSGPRLVAGAAAGVGIGTAVTGIGDDGALASANGACDMQQVLQQ